MEEDLKDVVEEEERKTGKKTLIEAPVVDTGPVGEKGKEARSVTVGVEKIDTKMKSGLVLHPQNCP
jgi:hypothetical protein